jgi:starch phosphorylase
VLARFKAAHGNNWDLLPEKAVFQLNDTHPTIAVAELARLLVDVEGLPWEKAWGLVTRVGAVRAGSQTVCRMRSSSGT